MNTGTQRRLDAPRRWIRRIFAYAAAIALPCLGAGAASETDAPVFNLRVASYQSLACFDCDGVALGDITGNGRMDILTSNGDDGETFWYAQGGDPETWTRHGIHTEDHPREIEGNDLADFNGDGQLEAVSLNQPGGAVLIHKHGGDPTGPWETAVLAADRPYVQASLVADVDGDGTPDLIYTWEGDAEDRGGVHWLRFTGGDVLNPDHWEEHVMAQHESAWWLAPARKDLSGNGAATDIAYTARNIPGRNPGARPGVFWLEPPEDDVTAPWTRHTVDETLAHPLHIDFGDLSGGGHGKDLVVGGFDTRHVTWYSFGDGWERHDIPLPEEVNGIQPDRVWNIKTARFGGERDGIFAPVTGDGQGAFLFYEFTGGAFRPNVLKYIDYHHPMDDRIILYDLHGDGQPEAFIPCSGTGSNRFFIFRFAWGPPFTPAERGEPGRLTPID